MSNGRRRLFTQAGVAVARVTKPAGSRQGELIVALTRLANEIDAWLDDMGASRHASSRHHARAARSPAGSSNRPGAAFRARR